METTNMFDKNGNEILVGSRVIKWWLMHMYNGTNVNVYKCHTITKEQKDNRVTYYLGDTIKNIWRGTDVVCVPDSFPIPDETNFYYKEDGTPEVFSGSESSKKINDYFMEVLFKGIIEENPRLKNK